MNTSLPTRLLLFLALLAGLLLAGNLRAEQVVVNAFGDSLTSGYPYWSGMDGNGCVPSSCNGGYEPPLQTMLRAGGREAVVQNWGRRGDTSSSGLARLDAVLAISNPRYILLMEGTNELYWGRHATVRDNLGKMIDKARARGVIPILGTFTPDLRYPQKDIPRANALLKELALKKEVAVADHYSAVIDNWRTLCTSDTMHPNREGYAIMARVWAEAIQTADRMNAPDLTPILMLLLDE
jgi:lysophospholipase L1-like esterase